MHTIPILFALLLIVQAAPAQEYRAATAQRAADAETVEELLEPIVGLREDLDSDIFVVRRNASATILQIIRHINKEHNWARDLVLQAIAPPDPRNKEFIEVYMRLRRLRGQTHMLAWDSRLTMVPQKNVLMVEVLDDLEDVLGKEIKHEIDPSLRIDITSRQPAHVLLQICRLTGLTPHCSAAQITLRKSDNPSRITNFAIITEDEQKFQIGSLDRDIKIVDITPIVFHKDSTPLWIRLDCDPADTFTCHCTYKEECKHTPENRGSSKESLNIQTSHLLKDAINKPISKGLLPKLEEIDKEAHTVIAISGGHHFHTFEANLDQTQYFRSGMQMVQTELEKTKEGWTVYLGVTIFRIPWISTTFGEDRLHHGITIANEYRFYNEKGVEIVGELSPIHFRECGNFKDQYAFLTFKCDEEPSTIRARIASKLIAEYIRIPRD